MAKPVAGPAQVWRNVDGGEPMPAWMNEVACWLAGGRFAIETRQGTVIAELGDWIVRNPGGKTFVCKSSNRS